MRTTIIAGLLLAFAASAQAAPTAAVKVDGGTVVGVSDGGLESFKGIPFAAPPVGNLRWRAPQPVVGWKGTKTADAFGPMCMQAARPNGLGGTARAQDMSEDCLTINVTSPVGAKKAPVMVWIYGGGFTAGASSIPTYSGDTFAKNGVVLVSFNYRLGRLGVFAHPALTKANADGGHLGNYGLMDQIAALKWVKRNIAKFGGDPDNVLIFGESAGGLSVNALMVSPEARGLFQRAIAESGYGRGPFHRMREDAPGRRAAETEGVEMAKDLGVTGNDLAALRALPADKIVDQLKPNGYLYFILDGKVLTDDMWATFRAKKEAPVPFLLGSNSYEFPGVPWKDRRNDLKAIMDDAGHDATIPAYGGVDFLDDHLMSDFLFTEEARGLARMHSANGYPTYVYLFGALSSDVPAFQKGAAHASELRYVFGTLNTGPKPLTGDVHKKLSNQMNAYWRNFATKGDPNGAGLPTWPRYDGQQIIEFTNAGPMGHPDVRNTRLDALSKAIDPRS